MEIQWFPGHMKKNLRELESSLKIIDAVICVLDARAPFSCINPELEKLFQNKKIIYCLNKIDMADKFVTDEWIKYFRSKNKVALAIDATKSACKNLLLSAINEATKEKQEKQKAKGIVSKIRVAIVGVPNTGKSTLLNTLAGNYVSKTGNIAGVTRSSAWIKLKNNIELMDNAGTLYPKLSNKFVAMNLAFLGSINDVVVDSDELAGLMIERLQKIASQKFFERYEIDNTLTNVDEIINAIGKKRGFLLKGDKVDYDRTCLAIIDDFRKCRIGKITLENPKDIGLV